MLRNYIPYNINSVSLTFILIKATTFVLLTFILIKEATFGSFCFRIVNKQFSLGNLSLISDCETVPWLLLL